MEDHMTLDLQHAMKASPTPDEAARGRFVSGMRSFILNDLASDLNHAYITRAAAKFRAAHGRDPQTSGDAHKALRGDPAFNIYSSMRVQAQKMVWSSVAGGVARDAERLEALANEVAAEPGSVSLTPDFVPPRNASAIDVHLMPGSYTGGEGLAAGATYDRGLAVFSMGLMGANLDDIGLSMAAYIKRRYPEFAPQHILDLGCTIGHNSLPWKQAYPDAKLTAIDVAAPGLRYASARAKLQGVDVDFVQMESDKLDLPDASVDMVFSSMFLHELPKKVRATTFAEANRVLRPGGLMLHMELPPNGQMAPFEAFYLDWDSYYNNEPYYKGYRDEDPQALCVGGGFDATDYFQFVVPSVGIYGDQAVTDAATCDAAHAVGAETTGRLADGVMWFGFGAWKR
jgi:ubiquinone/menaquinone biosynthesis C-methylase UbiE